MAYTARPYVRPAYESGLRLGDLMRSRGRNLAEREYARGEASARMWSNVGNTIAGTVQGFTEAREKEKAEQEVKAEKEALSKQDAAFLELLQREPNPDPKKVIAIYGPQRGMPIASGVHAFNQLEAGQVKDARDTAGRLAVGMKASSPTLRTQFWPAIRAAAIKGGLGSAEEIPEQSSPEYLDAIIGWASGKEPAKPEDFTLSPGQQRFGADGQQKAAVPATPSQQGGFNLSPGQTRFGPDGKPMASLPAAPSAPSRDTEPLIAVMGDDGQPVLMPRSQAAGRRPASNREQGRPVTSGDANRIAELDTSLSDLDVLSKQLGTTGAASKVGALLPNAVTELTGWGLDAKSRQGTIDRVKQVIGKALEGGVLRKEDEYKYTKILPTIGDPPSVAKSKLLELQKALVQRRQTTLEALTDAGYDTTKFGDTTTAATVGGDWIDLGNGIRFREKP